MKNATSPRSLVALQRQQQAVELRRSGRSYREIAHANGIGVTTAHRLISGAMAEARSAVAEDVVELRALELSRLDGLMVALWPKARQGDLGAVDRVLRIMERRARLLGLDAPVKVARTNAAGDEDEGDGTRYIVPVPAQMSLDEWVRRFTPAGSTSGVEESRAPP